MFNTGIGWTEMMVIAAIALIVVGPKDLPGMLQQVGRAFGQLRRMGNEFKAEINKAAAIDEIKDIKTSVTKPLTQTRADIEGEMRSLPSLDSIAKNSTDMPPWDDVAESGHQSLGDAVRRSVKEREEAAQKAATDESLKPVKEPASPANADVAKAEVAKAEVAETDKPKAKPARAKSRKSSTTKSSTAKSSASKSTASKSKAAKSPPSKSKSAASKTPATQSSETGAKSKTSDSGNKDEAKATSRAAKPRTAAGKKPATRTRKRAAAKSSASASTQGNEAAAQPVGDDA